MQGRLLFFSLLAFLSLSLSDADAQAPSDTLMSLADSQLAAGKWDAALSTLERIPLFALDESGRAQVMTGMLSAQCHSGRYEEFEALLSEALLTGSFDEDRSERIENYLADNSLKLKKEDTALLLSALPGLGHFYAGKPLDGIGYLALNAGVVAVGVAAFCSGLYVGAFLGGGMVLARTHSMNSASAVKAVSLRNDALRRERCESILNLLLE